MNLLVDGHNLIGQTPGLSLADPDDEAKLVMLLRRIATSKRGNAIVIVFDHGVYGHPQQLNGYGITCHFARSPQDADTQLIRRIKALRQPRNWSLVTSDRRVADVAVEHGMRVIDSRVFAARLNPTPNDDIPLADKIDRKLSPTEISEWFKIFGMEPDSEEELGQHNFLPPERKSKRHHRKK